MRLVFRLDTDNGGITAYATKTEALKAVAEDGGSVFQDYSDLVSLAPNLSLTTLVDCWNSLPEVTPVRKFTDRKTAVKRIWTAVEEKLTPAMIAAFQPAALPASQPAATAPAKEAPHQEAPHQEAPAREGSKKAQAIAMLKDGTTREALQNALGWLPHTTRGFLSILGKTHKIEVHKTGIDGKRFYRMA